MIALTFGEAQDRFGQLLEMAQRETVAITRHGRPAAFLISPHEMTELLDARSQRSKAVTELEEWASGISNPANSNLTDDEVNRLIHDAR